MRTKLLFILLIPYITFSQIFAGIEIGGKGMKTTILQLNDLNSGNYKLIDSWTESTPISKNISKEGVINDDDMITTLNLLKKNYDKLMFDKKINKDNIYVVVSSGVGIAKNTNVFLEKINILLKVKSKVITVEEEVKLMILGGIPYNNILESISLDIGGGNTKGGYVLDLKTDKNQTPLSLNYGTVSLTEKIKKSLKNPSDFNEFLEKSTIINDSIKLSFNETLSNNTVFNRRKNLYFSGGAIWAFITLSQNKDKNEYKIFSLADVKNYHNDLINNYEKFQNLSSSNPSVKKVLDTYSRQYLVSGNLILIDLMESIKDIETKNIYYVSTGYLSWLKAYIIENNKDLKKSKHINKQNIVTFRTTEF